MSIMMSQHPFAGHTVFFATQHGKEKILAPLFEPLGMTCVAADVDTDQFGTFSQEIQRTGSVRETLRKKISAAAQKIPEAQFVIASEGSFAPHPIVGFYQTDLESLLLWHRTTNSEIYAEFLDTAPNHDQITLHSSDEYESFLKKIRFPDHGLIVHPESSVLPIYKGIHHETELKRALENCFLNSKTGRIVLATDLRACHSPTRRNAIAKAGEKMIAKLKSLCPSCQFPGFDITQGIPGLTCSDCGLASQIPKSVLWGCAVCDYKEETPRPDGQQELDPKYCDYCNP